MRRLFFWGGLALAAFVFAAPAAANTTVPVKMTITEGAIPGLVGGCPVALADEGFCGSGQVIPLGHATTTLQFGAACVGDCDFRTVTLAGGQIFIDEVFSNPSCPGVCQPNRAEVTFGTLTDTIVGGTGTYAGATGDLTGSVSSAGPHTQTQLSGSIHFDP